VSMRPHPRIDKVWSGPCRGALLGWSLACGTLTWAQSPPDSVPGPQLEVGVGLSKSPGWLGDDHSVVHATGWVNAEYTSMAFGRLQLNGGSLTMDPSINWDPWVKGVASFGVMVGYHDNPSIGEGRNPGVPGSVAGLDGGVQAVLSMAGAPLFVQARKAFAAEQGSILVVGSYLPIHLTGNLTLAFLPTARWLDQKQSRLCFDAPAGTRPGGSAAYLADAGFQDVALEAVVDWQISKHVHSVTSASQRQLTGSASQTPLTDTRTQRAYCFGFSYHY